MKLPIWIAVIALMTGVTCAQARAQVQTQTVARLPSPAEVAHLQPARWSRPVENQSQNWNPGDIEQFFDDRISLNDSIFVDSRGKATPRSPLCVDEKCRCWDCLHEDHKNTGFFDFNTYWDTREQTVTTVNILLNLPGKLQYFQFFNFESAFDQGSHDWTGFYTEMNLRRPIHDERPWLKAMDWTLQYADGSAPHGALRLGTMLRFHDAPGALGAFTKDTLKVRYALNFHFIEADGTGWQLEHTIRRDFWDKRAYVFCFCDHNLDNGGRDSTWVTETQVGFLLMDNLYAVAEYRYNSFLPAAFREGLGLGLEYIVRFR